jgi:hypothetical protein
VNNGHNLLNLPLADRVSAREFRATPCASSALRKHMPEQEYSIERVGIPNLDFTGEMIGSSGGPSPQLKTYRTKGGNFIGELRGDSKRSKANSFDKPGDLIVWLKAEVGNPITLLVQNAVEEAAKNDNAFKAAWNVRVD